MLKRVALSASCLLSLAACKPVVDSVALTPAALTLNAGGEAKDLKAQAKDKDGKDIAEAPFTWASSDANVATVSPEGKVAAKADGEATITATTGEKSGTAKVTVVIPTTLEMVPAALTLKTGGAAEKLTARVLSGKGQPMADRAVTFASDKDAVATVAADGSVSPVGVGTATITAKSDKLTGTATVVVTAAAPAEEPKPAEEAKPAKKGKK